LISKAKQKKYFPSPSRFSPKHSLPPFPSTSTQLEVSKIKGWKEESSTSWKCLQFVPMKVNLENVMSFWSSFDKWVEGGSIKN
jgi:hypothetical protein